MLNSRMFMAGAVMALAAATACSGINLRGQQTPYGTRIEPSPTRGVSPAVARAGSRGGSAVKRECRGRVEEGWIAIDFVADSAGCGGLHASRFPVAIVTNYTTLPIDTELAVCDVERIPSGWMFMGRDEEDTRCPDDTPPDKPHATVKWIKRVY